MGFLRRSRINIRASLDEVVQKLQELRPDSLYSYPSYLVMLCSRERSSDLSNLSLILVLTSGELRDPNMKEELAEHFLVPIVDFYGAAEQPYLSSECPLQNGGQHINMLNTLAEIVRNGERTGRGEEGEIVITTLTNRAMPLIRYNIGDVGTISGDECPCGRHGEILYNLHGRRDDFLKTRNGREIPAILVRSIITHPKIRGYRITQERVDRFTIQLMGKDVDEDIQMTITDSLSKIMDDPDLTVRFERVGTLGLDPSGKRRVVICRF